MNFLYSIGASVVLLGALFKLQHWPYANIILPIGMLTEVVIFFFSAFEPSVEIPDWSKVYPQLRETYLEEENDFNYPVAAPQSVTIESILEKADISPELLAKVKKGLQDLSNTASGIADISSASLATEAYVRNLTEATDSISGFKDINTRAAHSIEKSTSDLVYSYDQSSQILGNSSKNLASTFSESSKKINDQLSVTGDKLAQSYKTFTESVNKDLQTLSDHSKAYNNGLSLVNSSLSAIHSSYELHLQHAKKLSAASEAALEGQSKMTELVNGSVEEAQKYRKQTEQLNKNLEALNNVYGNMLGAMNVKG